MENRRFILIALLGVVLFFLYQAWQKDYAPAPHATAQATAESLAAMQTDDDTLPQLSESDDDQPRIDAGDQRGASSAPRVTAAGRVHVDTGLIHAEISLDGGELRRLELKNYPVSKKQPDTPLSLLDDRAGRLFILQTGVAGSQAPLVSHRSQFVAEQAQYQIEQGADHLDVVLTTQDETVSVRKVYRFYANSYRVDVQHQIHNNSSLALKASAYSRLKRTEFKAGDEPPFVSTFTGVGFYQQKDEGGDKYRFVKTKLDKLGKEAFETRQDGGWIALLQHYFVAAIIPDARQAGTFSARTLANGPVPQYMAQYVGPAQSIEPGQTAAFDTELYLGPKLQDHVSQVAPGFDLTLDYGILTPISEPLFWLLTKLHNLLGNWGLAIIALTLLVKGAMFKLSEAQYRSMAKMKKFGPRIQEIKDRHGDDREKMQKAMMDLYKKEGFNPLAGCWPMLVQFPVFIALYWVLLESVELRQAPFALWLQDLTSPDPYFVLPVLFGISMFIQQRLSGHQATDPLQQKIMNIMPIGLAVFFTMFQSGLVLYWFTSNLIGIIQQWIITKKLEHDDAVKAAHRR